MKQIPPGGEGKITVEVSTNGYGGKKIRQVIRIQTNDNNKPWLNVVLTGFVERFAEINPKRVSLTGKVGKEIKSQVIIKPIEKYPFEITNVRLKNGQFIKYSLDKQTDQKQSGWVLTVENLKKDRPIL